MSKEAFCNYHIDNHLHQGLGLLSNLFLRIRIPSQWNKIREFGGPRSTLSVSRRQPGLPPTSFWFLSPGQSAARSRLSKVNSEDSLRQATSKYLEERRLKNLETLLWYLNTQLQWPWHPVTSAVLKLAAKDGGAVLAVSFYGTWDTLVMACGPLGTHHISLDLRSLLCQREGLDSGDKNLSLPTTQAPYGLSYEIQNLHNITGRQWLSP